jgi:hypothetical protein
MVTLPLKALKKLKKKLKRAYQAVAHAEQQVERHKGIAATQVTRAEQAINAWDKHSHQICDALGDDYYSDDGAGFDYDNMLKGIEKLHQELHEAKEGSDRLYEKCHSLQRRNEKFYELWQAAMKWAAQGSRSRWSTRASLELWDTVKALEAEDEG